MKIPIVTKHKVTTQLSEEVLQFGFRTGIVAATLIGLWALLTFTAALLPTGPLGLIKGYIAAITGG